MVAVSFIGGGNWSTRNIVVKEFLGLLFFSFKSECHKFKKKGFVLNEYE
jgi:hypothetical protein